MNLMVWSARETASREIIGHRSLEPQPLVPGLLGSRERWLERQDPVHLACFNFRNYPPEINSG